MVQTKEKRLVRSEIPEHLTWDLTDLFQNDSDWEKELNVLESELSSVTKFKGTLKDSPTHLLHCLKAFEDFYKRANIVSIYASLKFSADGTDPVNQGNTSKVASFLSNVSASLSFINAEILEIPEETLNHFYKEEPELQDFKKMIDEILVEKPHKLSPETEETLAALGEVHSAPYMIYQRSKSSDMQFDAIHTEEYELPMSFALYEDRYEISPNTEVRRKAYDSFVKTLQQYKNTFAATYATEVKKQVVTAKLRKYDSVTHMLLQPQKVTLEMYHNQLDIIQQELSPIMRKYARLKKQVLQLDELNFCDLKAPLDPEFNPETTYEEASKVILEALEVMGPEYLSIMKKGLTERWVDLADNVGKSTGAFCSSPYGVHPYILITWTDTMRGAFVLAHELGHAGHFYLAGNNQRLFNTRPSMYFVEAPSTLNELLLGQYLLSKTDDKRMKRWVITQLLGTYYHNFVTHLLEGELQRRVYAWAEAGKPITANVLSDLKANILKSFWGDEVAIDEGAALTWMRQPHYYMGLYPYTYSAGLTASTAVAQKIQQEGKPAVEKWLEVLKAGGTMTPLELMNHAGVDMTNPESIRKAVSFVGTLVDQLVDSYN